MQPEFAVGARNAVHTCINVGPRDRVGIIRDRPRKHIAEAIEEEVLTTGAAVRVWTMEDQVSRPVTSFPRSLADEILRFRPTASFFMAPPRKAYGTYLPRTDAGPPYARAAEPARAHD